MENKFDHIIDYMKNHQTESIVYISLILTVFLALLIFFGFINIAIPLIIIGILTVLIFSMGVAIAIVIFLTD